MSQTLYASFADASNAEKAAGALLDFGVRNEDISLVSREYDNDNVRRDYTAHSATVAEREIPGAAVYNDTDTIDTNRDINNQNYNYNTGTGTNYTNRDNNNYVADKDTDSNTTYINHSTGEGDRTELAAKQGLSTTTPGDAAAGAAKGAGIGLGIGAIAALASLAVPGIGLVVGGGALATALAGAAGATAAGAVAGGVHGYLKDQGVPDEVAENYHHAIKNGGAILAITVPSNDVTELTVREILGKYHAGNINTYGAVAA